MESTTEKEYLKAVTVSQKEYFTNLTATQQAEHENMALGLGSGPLAKERIFRWRFTNDINRGGKRVLHGRNVDYQSFDGNTFLEFKALNNPTWNPALNDYLVDCNFGLAWVCPKPKPGYEKSQSEITENKLWLGFSGMLHHVVAAVTGGKYSFVAFYVDEQQMFKRPTEENPYYCETPQTKLKIGVVTNLVRILTNVDVQPEDLVHQHVRDETFSHRWESHLYDQAFIARQNHNVILMKNN